MRTPTSASALRAARTLLGFSQARVAEELGVVRLAIVQAETEAEGKVDIKLKLVDLYRENGIEFLGETSIGEPIKSAGARIRRSSRSGEHAGANALNLGIVLRAARKLIGIEQKALAAELDLSVSTISQLERGTHWNKPLAALRAYYVNRGVEFVGWSDLDSQELHGAGVRWKTYETVKGNETTAIENDTPTA